MEAQDAELRTTICDGFTADIDAAHGDHHRMTNSAPLAPSVWTSLSGSLGLDGHTPYRVLDLFSGPGGLSLGFRMAGFDIVAAVDCDPHCALTYEYSHPTAAFVQRDARFLPTDELVSMVGCEPDLIIGGPPCQGFSKANPDRAVYHPASLVSWEFVRFVLDLRPPVFVMENVPGFVHRINGGVPWEAFQARFEDSDYQLITWRLSSDRYGVPQIRERIFVVGLRPSVAGASLHGPPSLGTRTAVRDAISDLPPLPDGGGGADLSAYGQCPDTPYQEWCRRGARVLSNHKSTRSQPYMIERFKHIPQNGNWKDIPAHLMDNYEDTSRIHSHIYRRLAWEHPAFTVANVRKTVTLHPEQDRILSAREAARLQSFPDTYRFLGSFESQLQQIADAVPPLLGYAVAVRVAGILEGAKVHTREPV